MVLHGQILYESLALVCDYTSYWLAAAGQTKYLLHATYDHDLRCLFVSFCSTPFTASLLFLPPSFLSLAFSTNSNENPLCSGALLISSHPFTFQPELPKAMVPYPARHPLLP
mmetsp:Transcript_6274/g.7759  ORF Transcript_6274/g.7759 Transcript_6274/m.7759 type:complete len:112 (-) Transcript_6274:181-516(-)